MIGPCVLSMQEAGRIRAGDRANGNPRKLSEWRLTSKDKQRLEAAAGLWGGSVSRWEDRGEWELYTSTAELPIMILLLLAVVCAFAAGWLLNEGTR